MHTDSDVRASILSTKGLNDEIWRCPLWDLPAFANLQIMRKYRFSIRDSNGGLCQHVSYGCHGLRFGLLWHGCGTYESKNHFSGDIYDCQLCHGSGLQPSMGNMTKLWEWSSIVKGLLQDNMLVEVMGCLNVVSTDQLKWTSSHFGSCEVIGISVIELGEYGITLQLSS